MFGDILDLPFARMNESVKLGIPAESCKTTN